MSLEAAYCRAMCTSVHLPWPTERERSTSRWVGGVNSLLWYHNNHPYISIARDKYLMTAENDHSIGYLHVLLLWLLVVVFHHVLLFYRYHLLSHLSHLDSFAFPLFLRQKALGFLVRGRKRRNCEHQRSSALVSAVCW